MTSSLLKLICSAVNSGDDIPDRRRKSPDINLYKPVLVSSSVKNNAIKDNPVSSVFFQFKLSPPWISYEEGGSVGEKKGGLVK